MRTSPWVTWPSPQPIDQRKLSFFFKKQSERERVSLSKNFCSVFRTLYPCCGDLSHGFWVRGQRHLKPCILTYFHCENLPETSAWSRHQRIFLKSKKRHLKLTTQRVQTFLGFVRVIWPQKSEKLHRLFVSFREAISGCDTGWFYWISLSSWPTFKCVW